MLPKFSWTSTDKGRRSVERISRTSGLPCCCREVRGGCRSGALKNQYTPPKGITRGSASRPVFSREFSIAGVGATNLVYAGFLGQRITPGLPSLAGASESPYIFWLSG